jgi:hypothetical protein
MSIGKERAPWSMEPVVKPPAATVRVMCQAWSIGGTSASLVLPAICDPTCAAAGVSRHSAYRSSCQAPIDASPPRGGARILRVDPVTTPRGVRNGFAYSSIRLVGERPGPEPAIFPSFVRVRDYASSRVSTGAPLMRPVYPPRSPPTTKPRPPISYSRYALLCWLPRIFTTATTFLSSLSTST